MGSNRGSRSGGLSYTGLMPVAFYYPDDSKHVTDTVHYTETVTKVANRSPR